MRVLVLLDTAHLGRLIDREPKPEADGAVTVPSGGDRADFVYLTLEQLGKRYPGVPLAGLSERGGAALVLVCNLFVDLLQARLDPRVRIEGRAR